MAMMDFFLTQLTKKVNHCPLALQVVILTQVFQFQKDVRLEVVHVLFLILTELHLALIQDLSQQVLLIMFIFPLGRLRMQFNTL